MTKYKCLFYTGLLIELNVIPLMYFTKGDYCVGSAFLGIILMFISHAMEMDAK